MVQRGEVYQVDLGDPTDDDDESIQGSEQGFERPAIIVQNDKYNGPSPITIIVPTTRGSESDARYDTNVFLPGSLDCFDVDSVAMANQVRAISQADRILYQRGSLPAEYMRKVDHALIDAVDLI